MRNQGEEAGGIKFAFFFPFLFFFLFFFASAPSGRELTSVSDGTGGSIVSEVISSTGSGALCAVDRGRKTEVGRVGGGKEKMPV